MGDRITTSVIEMMANERTELKNALAKRFSDVAYASGEQGNEEVCMDYVEDCIEDCSAEVAKAITCETFYIGEEEPGEEEHCSNTGNDFVWNTNAAEYSPLFEDPDTFAELCGKLNCVAAASEEICELVYSNQKHMRLYRFVRAH